MPERVSLKLGHTPDPFARIGGTPGTPRIAKSHAFQLLIRELERYTRGEIHGRSVLVSGHRGSGKTTLVRAAIEDVLRRRGELKLPRRPLFVPLHGPDLLPREGRPVEHPVLEAAEPTEPPEAAAEPDEEGGEEDENDGEETTDEEAAAEPAGERGSELDLEAGRFLRRITIGLYRALAREYAEAARTRLRELADRGQALPTGWTELPAQLELELDESPDPSLLRDCWNRLGALERGILFREATNPDQGAREIVALATAAQAYRAVTGRVSYRRTASDQLKAVQTAETNATLDLKQLLPVIMAVLTGGIVGVGVLTGSPLNGAIAGIATLIAGVVGAATFTYASERKRTRKATSSYTFIREVSLSTLDRELPILIERVRNAGITPIFVIDELDKVERLKERMGPLVNHLKHFVTEHFFFFLTDRDYFEYLEEQAIHEPYPEEHTYFTHRIFVLYRPPELHRHLRQIIEIPDDIPKSDRSVAELDRAGIEYLLLHRARLHLFDLRRQLASYADADGSLAFEKEQTTSHLGYRVNITAQLAVEHLLNTGELKDRLDQDPYFGQVAYDALYYPSRKWALGGADVDTSKDAFEKYLARRMRLDEPGARNESAKKKKAQTATTKGKGNGGSTTDEGDEGLPLSTADLDLLRDKMVAVVELLANPKELLKQLSTVDPPIPVLGCIPKDAAGTPQPLLVRDKRKKQLYHWQVDSFGLVRGAGFVTEEMTPAAALEAIALIREMAAFLENISEGQVDLQALAAHFRVLSISPGWTQAQAAADNITAAPSRPAQEVAKDVGMLKAYRDMLENWAGGLGLALSQAAMIGSCARELSRGEGLLLGLERLKDALDLGSLQSAEELETVLRDFALAFGSWDPDYPSFRADPAAWYTHFRKLIDDLAEPVDDVQAGDLTSFALDVWKTRIEDYQLNGTRQFDLSLVDLYGPVLGVRPLEHLKPNFDDMTLAGWSRLLFATFELKDAQDPERVPSWVVPTALIELGLSKPDPAFLEQKWFRRRALTEELELMEKWFTSGHWTTTEWSLPRTSALILARDAASPTAEWLCSAEHGGLLVEQSRFSETMKALDRLQSMLSHPFSVLLAEPTNGRVPTDVSLPVYVLLFGDDRYEGEHPIIRDPASLDDAMEQVLKRQSAAS